MSEEKEKTELYIFDSSAFITINRFYPFSLVPDLWDKLSSMIKDRRIISHKFVLEEINPKTENPDFLGNWVSDKVDIFKPITREQTNYVAEILGKFPKLIDYKKEKDQADPWIIALARELNEQPSLFETEVIVVSQESKTSPHKIPAACKYFDIKHENLFDLFKSKNWIFRLEENNKAKETGD
jgi:hypothetical protein